VFAWTHEDMPRINPEDIFHYLNINSTMKPVKQKMRKFAPKRNAAIAKEVEKLLKANFIQEVYYPDWLANVILVKKFQREVEDVRGLHRFEQSLSKRQLSSPVHRCIGRLYC
jgi:hypothetical protein